MKKILLAIVICFTACKKEKLGVRTDNRFTTITRPVSTSRIVNLSGANQVWANGKRLTDSVFYDPLGPDFYKFVPTDYFPKTGLLGTSWQIPQDLFGTTGKLELKFGYIGTSTTVGSDVFTMPAIEEEYNKPVDYYLLPKYVANGLQNYVAIKRGVVQPSKPDHFKIRIINLTSAITNSLVQVEELSGPVSLTFADGTPVSAATTGISQGKRISEYVELPYGTYQFRVLTANGRQVPGTAPTADNSYKVIDLATSTIAVNYGGGVLSSKLTFAPIMTYQPGGVYTIVVTPYNFSYFMSPQEQTTGALQNAFHIINDVSTVANTTYCRVQAANAWPAAGQVSFRMAGKALSVGLHPGEASDYGNYIQGDYTVEAINASGKVLASLTQTIRASQNYTIWLYPDESGKGQILMVPNDLSGISASIIGSQDDASQLISQANYLFNKRFLNLSPDNPYITFTLDNGQPVSSNIRSGILETKNPYVSNGGFRFFLPYEFMAYRSTPNVLPGTWAKDIEVLKSSKFVASESLYLTPGREVPAQEPGIYTVALIGRSGANVPAAQKARFIIVKHNR